MHEDITFQAASTTPDTVAAALKQRGAVLLRGLFPREHALYAGRAVAKSSSDLRAMLEREVNDMPLCFADVSQEGEAPPVFPGGMPLETFSDPLSFSGMDRRWYYEGERNYKRWFWERAGTFPNLLLSMLTRSLAPRIAQAFFEGGLVMPYQQLSVRYQRADIARQSYGFHQDGSYHSREISERNSLTVWAPLADCGEDAPGLELYPYPLQEILPMPPGTSPPHLFCDEELVMQRYGDKLWVPRMQAGDVLMFTGFTVHRSHITPDMTKERQSADFRFYPAKNTPPFANNATGWTLRLP